MVNLIWKEIIIASLEKDGTLYISPHWCKEAGVTKIVVTSGWFGSEPSFTKVLVKPPEVQGGK